jgi:hypothetical protein
MRTRQRENRLGAVASAMGALAAILAACHGRERAELLVKCYAEPIRKLARVLLEAGELPGHEVERILAQHGVQRGGLTPVCVPQPQERYFERRNGVTCPTADPDPMRKVAVFERRCDGYMGGG